MWPYGIERGNFQFDRGWSKGDLLPVEISFEFWFPSGSGTMQYHSLLWCGTAAVKCSFCQLCNCKQYIKVFCMQCNMQLSYDICEIRFIKCIFNLQPFFFFLFFSFEKWFSLLDLLALELYMEPRFTSNSGSSCLTSECWDCRIHYHTQLKKCFKVTPSLSGHDSILIKEHLHFNPPCLNQPHPKYKIRI